MIEANWEQELFDRVYNEVLDNLNEKKETNKIQMEDVENLLRDLYIREDNNQTGRGLFKATELEAEIAAHQAFLYLWKKETGD
ncbi:hypothetical protein [Spirochaeta cellobiosiphila]|uniref:hypothetical protein n=1 Tax=Spirochaeta cellobiosiphila TaxID=504483 RepID=UPI00041E595E|nr:hypothetical protein [Spirochaeta cellobiosiphila]